MLKLLHCGDIHLDSPFSLLDHAEAQRRRDELRRTFLEMLALARTEGAAVVLIAGDLFDHGFATAETLDLLCEAFTAMEDIRFVISPGNHDAASAGSVYLGNRFPTNVTVFTRETPDYVDFDDLGLRVWGYGFTADRLEASPLAGQSLAVEGKVSVLCAHADLGAPLSKYAPLSGADLAASGLCYAALGHVHNPGEAQVFGTTTAAYSGCLVGRSYDECGIGGAVLVGIEDGHVAECRRVPLAHRQYRIEPLTVDGASSDADVTAALTAMITASGMGEETALRVLLQDPDLSLSLVQLCGQTAHDCHALFVKSQRLSKRNFIVFHGADDLFQSRQRLLVIHFFHNNSFSIPSTVARTVPSANLTVIGLPTSKSVAEVATAPRSSAATA